VFKMMSLSDTKALKSQLAQWADLPGLARVIPCHGDPVQAGPGPALKGASAAL
jgi:hypothetical protein